MHPRRIVCLTEEPTEMLYLLGEEERIVGISAYTVRPPRAAQEKPKVSAFLSGNLRRILALQPELCIGFSDIQADLASKLIAAGLNVWVSNQRSIEEIFETMQMLGRIVGRGVEASRLTEEWRHSLDAIRRQNEGRPRPRVFFQEWNEPLICGIHWVSELIEICGGIDCFADRRTGRMARDRILQAGDVERAAPQAIIGSWCGKAVDYGWIAAQEEWKTTPAVRNGCLYEIDSSIILQPGPALFLEGAAALQECIERARESMVD